MLDSLREIKKKNKKTALESFTTSIKSEFLEMRPRHCLKAALWLMLTYNYHGKNMSNYHSLFLILQIISFVISLLSFTMIPCRMTFPRNISGETRVPLCPYQMLCKNSFKFGVYLYITKLVSWPRGYFFVDKNTDIASGWASLGF